MRRALELGLVCWAVLGCLIACEDDKAPSIFAVGGDPGPAANSGGNNGGGGYDAAIGLTPSSYYAEPDGGFPVCSTAPASVTLMLEGVTYNIEPIETDYYICRDRTLTLFGCDSAQEACFSLLLTEGATQVSRVHRADGGFDWVTESTTEIAVDLPEPVPCETAGGLLLISLSHRVAGVTDASASDAGAADASAPDGAATQLTLDMLVSETRCLI